MIVVQNKYISYIFERKPFFYLAIAGILCILLFFLAIALGSEVIPLSNVIQSLFGKGQGTSQFIIQELRLPRAITALLAGGSLAVAGAIVQVVIKNPLTSPDLLGINSGGTVGAMFYLFFFQSFVPFLFFPIFVFAGSAMAIAILLFFLKNKIETFRLILIGLALNSIFAAITTASLIYTNEKLGSILYVWTIGSTYGVSSQSAQIMLVISVILMFLILPLSRILNLHVYPDEIVVNAGEKLPEQRRALLLISVLFSTVAVAYVGPVGFVGLIAPHLAKKIIPRDYFFILPFTFLLGAILTLFADILGRTWNPPYEFPLGVFTTMIGAPYFIYILLKMEGRRI
ncbi:MAG: FecCD family ABC transporter permease [Brevinema sp.]